MRIGFTGTRNGLTSAQRVSLKAQLKLLSAVDAHHGCCVGADTEFVELCAVALNGLERIVAHPGDLNALTDADALAMSDVQHKPKTNMARNRDIVDACSLLLACPKGPEEVRSGTWMTIRYAAKQKRPCLIIWPDGRVEERILR